MNHVVNFNFSDDLKNLAYLSLKNLKAGKIVLINDVLTEDKQLIERFINILGAPNLAARSLNESQSLFQQVRDYEVPKKDPYGYEILSTTNKYFPLHTDNYCNEKPCDVVGLLCIRKANLGGETIFLRLDDIINNISPDLFELLKLPTYSHPSGLKEIIRFNDNFEISYNYKDIIQCNETANIKMSSLAMESLILFESFLEKNSQIISLRENDLILFNNKLHLHGRNSFPENSDRYLLRFRLFWRI